MDEPSESIDGAGVGPAADPLAPTSVPPKAQPADIVLSTAAFFFSVWVTFPDLHWKLVLVIALSLSLVCLVTILYLFRSPRYRRATMAGAVRTSDVAADSDLLPFPGAVGEDGKPQARSFSLFVVLHTLLFAKAHPPFLA